MIVDCPRLLAYRFPYLTSCLLLHASFKVSSTLCQDLQRYSSCSEPTLLSYVCTSFAVLCSPPSILYGTILISTRYRDMRSVANGYSSSTLIGVTCRCISLGCSCYNHTVPPVASAPSSSDPSSWPISSSPSRSLCNCSTCHSMYAVAAL
ncbi:hypothetical protein EV361DRAFT_169358 [Lentinula raphanica]|nr:hypothetical protein EV361DRAFT_169358 [Lentinula raphanica]